ncbi:HD-domain/PDEase-like protein [Backusella circina FSU 941]|nr:HD-domain/PDEase-like protein [Backusella circina FSU 941]
MITDAVQKVSELVPVIVYSNNEDTAFMLECIQAGAAEYLLQPLRADVIKTMFLTLHRHSTKYTESPLYEDHLVSCSTISTVTSVISPITPTAPPHSAYLPDRIQDRIKTLVSKDSSDRKAALKKRVSQWDFSPLNLSHEDLIHCVVIIFSQLFLLPELTYFTQAQLYDFILDLSNAYHETNPYHNFAHAVDVLQCTYYFLCQLGLLSFADNSPCKHQTTDYRILRPRDLFALLIAAIGHDTAHPGVNNAFLHQFDKIMGGNDSIEYKATDMALHGDYVTKIKEQKNRLKDSDPNDWDAPQCFEERLLFCSGLMKCADISNVARPFPRAFEWAQILVEEFASQGDIERELGMNVLPMNDREKIILEDSQIGFIRFVALGLFEIVKDSMEELSFPVDHIKENLAIWEKRKKDKTDHLQHIADDTQSTIVVDDKSNDPEPTDYNTQAADVLSNKNELHHYTKMPTVAMTQLVLNDNRKVDQQYTSDDWDPHETSGPVYCQCTIQ